MSAAQRVHDTPEILELIYRRVESVVKNGLDDPGKVRQARKCLAITSRSFWDLVTRARLVHPTIKVYNRFMLPTVGPLLPPC